MGAGCLSQWWPAPFVICGTEYATAEHWMMASKARLMGDHDTAERILTCGSPSEAKQIGRRVRPFDQRRWDAIRFDLVVCGNLAKFTQHADLGEYLLGTGKQILVEASPWDRVWGIGLAADDPRVREPDHWRGSNLLGFALMEVRTRIDAHVGALSTKRTAPVAAFPDFTAVPGFGAKRERSVRRRTAPGRSAKAKRQRRL
ncbi:NADAR family protein [Nocardia wallacei]|uniref:NADAR family protein n=1 Tax=Nocardia wallacei TaxID=480035 RepID=UPI0024540FEB|nr:NADAR family protein [Nocardia wallacei]